MKSAKEVPVLMYHHLVKKNDNKFKKDPCVINNKDFEKQMKYLYENDFNTITLKELEMFIKGEMDLPFKSILITFDDGYESSFLYAYPILRKFSFKAVNFIITNKISNEKGIKYLNKEKLNKMSDVFEYGSHTHNLHREDKNNRSFLITKPRKELIKDLRLSMSILNTKYFAYPFGDYEEDTINLLKEVGFVMAFTVTGGNVKLKDDMFKLKRNHVGPNTTIDEFIKIVENKV
ncbi:MAG: polysaccharide deacetylase family protein [Firmicutes bacterium]|nr:polysaccharide deacetylase family protein [Bacillota bacterium]